MRRNTVRRLGIIGTMALVTAVWAFQQFDPKRERSGATAAAKTALEGKKPPELAVSQWMNTDGKSLDWKVLKGKVVLIDFWAHWCGPCKAAVPHLKELYAKHKDQGLVIIGVHADPNLNAMRASVAELGMTWPIALDAERKTMGAFQCDSYPDYCFIDRKGTLRFVDVANAEVDATAALLLAEK